MQIIRTISGVALSVVVTFGLILAIPEVLSRTLKTEYPLAVVTSGSMWPTFKSGDLILVRGVSGDVLGVSDIAVYEHDNGFAIHRVVQKGDDTFTAKGDANTKSDDPVSYDQLVGRALEIWGRPVRIPYVGSFGSFLRNLMQR